MNSNEKKKQQLGISFGTASHRLRKSIMFDMSKKLNLDICYRCNKKIESVEEFSIDHKENWQDSENPVELFFSIENIAFSHLVCNVDAAEQIKRNKKNKFGFKGVEFDKRRNKFRARIWNGEKYLRSGYFDSAEDAGKEYIKMELSPNDGIGRLA